MMCDGCENVETCLGAGPTLPTKASTAQRAYRVDLLDTIAVVMHDTAGKAKLAAFKCAKDAGYRPEWKDIRARRAREYDGAYIFPSKGIFALRGVCYNPEYLKCAGGRTIKTADGK